MYIQTQTHDVISIQITSFLWWRNYSYQNAVRWSQGFKLQFIEILFIYYIKVSNYKLKFHIANFSKKLIVIRIKMILKSLREGKRK